MEDRTEREDSLKKSGKQHGDQGSGVRRKMMAEIKRKFHIQFKSIRNRMIFSFLLVFLAVIIFMGTGIYLFTVDMLESRNQRSYEQVLESAENVLADRISIYEGTARGILDNQSVQNTLQMEDDSYGGFTGMC